MIYYLSKFPSIVKLLIKLINLLSPSLYHNIHKISHFKRVFFYINFERIEGDYIEFGTFEGNSLMSSYYANKSTSKVDKLVMTKDPIKRKFIGFDSFEDGFKYNIPEDKHPNWTENLLSSSYDKTLKKINKISKNDFILVKGYIEDTSKEVINNNYLINDYKINKISVALFDADLKSPTLEGLRLIRNKLQQGSILMFDDYYTYKSHKNLGEQGALNDFIKENKDIEITDFGNYGNAGKTFVISAINN